MLVLPESQVHVVLSGDTEKVLPGSHLVIQVVKIMQKDLKERDAEFESFAFCVFLNDSNDSKEEILSARGVPL